MNASFVPCWFEALDRGTGWRLYIGNSLEGLCNGVGKGSGLRLSVIGRLNKEIGCLTDVWHAVFGAVDERSKGRVEGSEIKSKSFYQRSPKHGIVLNLSRVHCSRVRNNLLALVSSNGRESALRIESEGSNSVKDLLISRITI